MTIEESIARPTVLVIDDTPNNIALAHAILAGTYELKVANSGVRGLAIAQADPVPDLILLDMMMPGMDGMEVCRRLQQSDVSRGIPVIFLTGAKIGDEEEGLQAGAVDYIAKPLSPAILLARVAAHIELSVARRRIAALEAQALAQVSDMGRCAHALERFEAVVGHDMRSSLSVVNGFATVLRKKLGSDGNEQVAMALSSIASSAKQLSGLVDHWCLVAGLLREPMRPALLDMNALVRAAVQDALGELPDPAKPEIVLETLPPSLADESALRQIWRQLVGNALTATNATAAPVLRISAAIGEGEIVYSVEDNGPGFPQEEHGRLFAPFGSLQDREERTGPGLGLFVAEQAVTRHGGRIWAEALEGRGARFSFSLPHATPAGIGKEQQA